MTRVTLALLGIWIGVACGCSREPTGEVVLGAAVDQELAAPILSSFTRSVDREIKPQATFESPTVPDVAEHILADPQQNGCDLFWDDALLDTVRLQEQGLLAQHDWDVPAGWPAVADDGTWCGFAARARVLIVNENLLADPAERPASILDLADPRWKDQCGMARPLDGTAATHAAVLYQQLGPDAFAEFFTGVAGNAKLLPTSRNVAQEVALGRLAWGVTDSDAAILQRDARMPVAIIFPDQQPSDFGALRIPHTIAILKHAPHPAAAHRLADFLVSPDTEERLAMGDSAQIPLFRSVTYQPRVLPSEGARWMNVDYEAAAKDWDKAAEVLKQCVQSAATR